MRGGGGGSLTPDKPRRPAAGWRRSLDPQARADAVRDAHALVHLRFRDLRNRNDPDDPATRAWREAIAAFHNAIGHAYPPGFWSDLERIARGETVDLEAVISFLEADPMFFRSGYAKARAAHLLKRCKLSSAQTQRLQATVLRLVDTRASQEFSAYCRLARKLDAPEFRAALRERLDGADPAAARRARWLLQRAQWPEAKD